VPSFEKLERRRHRAGDVAARHRGRCALGARPSNGAAEASKEQVAAAAKLLRGQIVRGADLRR
jgi:hypothetical protein